MKAWIAATACVAGTVCAQTTWNLATGYRADTFHTRNIVQFAGDVSKATNGALQIDVRPDNSLVKLADIPQAVQSGKIMAGEAIMSGMGPEMPIAGADAVPFVVGSYEDAHRMWVAQRPLIERHFAARGLKPLYAVPWPPQGLYTSTPIRHASDFAGTRMRTYNPSTVRIAELLGATPVDVPTSQLDQAFASKRIDSMITSAVTGVESQAWTRVRYYYEINAWFPKNIVFVNLAAFDALAPPVRQALLDAAAQAETRGWMMSQAAAADAASELRSKGMTVGRAAPEFEAELKRMGDQFSLEWVRAVGNEANQIFVPYYFGKTH